MNDAKEKTVLATSVGADERQPFQTNIENIIPTSTEEINDFDVNSSENYEEMLRQMQRMTSPYYLHTVSMTELYQTTYKSRPPIIGGLLYGGAYILAGAPKSGKSFLVAQIAYHVSTGEKLWEFEVHQGTVLYLALEDDYQRIQSRMFMMYGVEDSDRHPIAIFCDEAHLYIPANTEKSIDDASLVTFERISKEGRKYGIGLVVISQRPSEVNRTVLSQSNNFIAMRLTNVDDQSVVKRLLPDSLGDYAEMLPILDIGEALVVGDASLLPSRIRITPPNMKPRSATIDFWDEWSKETTAVDISSAIESLRKQSK